jgi:hypothetical protein
MILINDGHVAYYGIEEYSVSTDKKYDKIKLPTANKERFIEFLVMQDGQTDYFTLSTSSPIGIAKSRIDIIK